MTKISIIIPTLNEKESIEKVIDSIPENNLRNRGYDVEILVVDGGSSDGTVEKIKEKEVKVFRAEGGKAQGVREGIKRSNGDFVFLIDGDGTYPADKICDMMNELENGSDMVLGSRFQGEISDGAMSIKNMMGNRFLTWLANRLYDTEVSDLCTGLRGFESNGLDAAELPGKDFEIEAGLHSLFCKKCISEVPIKYIEREGESKLVTSDGFKIAARLLKERFRRNNGG